MGGLTWFAIPFTLATTMGLAYLGLSSSQAGSAAAYLGQCGQNRIRTCSLVENLEMTMEKGLKFETRTACCWLNQWHSWVHPGYYFAKQGIPGTGQEKKNTCSDLVDIVCQHYHNSRIVTI
jgi:hypothetical protein